MRIRTIRERERLPIGSSVEGLTYGEAAALARRSSGLPAGALTWEYRGLRFGPFCGIICAGDTILEILPKVANIAGDTESRGVLVSMLRAAGQLAEPSAGKPPLEQQRLYLLDIFVLDFCELVHALLRRDAIRTYESWEENLPVLRGRLNLPMHLRLNMINTGSLHCQFDELSADNPHNRILKSVLAKLLSKAVGLETKSAVNGLLRRMKDVSSLECSVVDIAKLTFNRLTCGWRPVFDRAALLLKGLYPDVHAGDVEGISLLFNMERLFETFIGRRIQREWRSTASAQIVLQGPQCWFAASGQRSLLRMQPDATLVGADREVIRIYDAKWKNLDIEAPSRGVVREDIYQVTSYAIRYNCSRAALLYPLGEGAKPGLVDIFSVPSACDLNIEIFALDVAGLVRGKSVPKELKPW